MQSTLTRFGFFIFLLGTCFYFYDFVLQVAPGVMALSLMQSFHMSAAILGSLSGVYFYSYTFMQIPAGLLLDRFGARTVLPWVVFICAVGAIVFGMAAHVPMLGVGRFLMGAGSAFAFLGSLYLATRWLPLHVFAFFAGVTQLVGSLGAIGGQTPLAFMIDKMGWRLSMIIFGIVGIVLAAVFRYFLKETSEQKAFAHSYSKGKVWVNLKTVLHHKQTWAIGIYSFAIWAPIASFAGLWGVPFLTISYHLSNLHAASFISVIWLAVALMSPAIGWLSDWIKHRVAPLWIAALFGLLGSIGLIYWPHNSSGWITIELAAIGIAASGQSLAFAVIRDIQPLQLTGAANGFNNMMIVFGGAIFQPLIGWLMDQHHAISLTSVATNYTFANFQHALWVLPALYILAFVSARFFIKETFCKISG